MTIYVEEGVEDEQLDGEILESPDETIQANNQTSNSTNLISIAKLIEEAPEDIVLSDEDIKDIEEVQNDFGEIAAQFLLQVRNEKNHKVKQIGEFD